MISTMQLAHLGRRLTDSELSREELDLAAMVGDGEDPSSADLYPVPNILALKE